MPQIPMYTQQVNPNQRTPIDLPQDAFGGNVAAAQAQLGNQISNVGQQLADRNYKLQLQKDQQKVVETETAYRQEMNDLLYNEETGLMNRTLNNADGSYGEYNTKAAEIQKKYADGLKSNDMKNMFNNMADGHRLAGQEEVLRHETAQAKAGREQSLNSNLQLNAADAAKNATEDNIFRLMADGYGKLEAYMNENGFDNQTILLKKQEYAGQLLAGALESTLAGNDVKSARMLLNKFSGQISPELKAKAEAKIQEVGFYSDGNSIWETVKGNRMSDGLPDLGKIEEKAKAEYKKLGYTDQMIEKGLDYVRSKAAELNQNLNRQWDANDRSFYNTVTGIKQKGGNMDEALKQVGRFARDNYDRELKQDAVKKLFMTGQKSDPAVYMSLWKGVLYNTTPEKDIDTAFRSGKLTVDDWEELKKDYFRGQLKDVKQGEKDTWDRITLLAQQKFGSNKLKQGEFLYDMKQTGRGKSEEELWAIAQEKLKSTGGSWFFNWGAQPQYKKDIKQRDEQNLAWGSVYNTFGSKDVALEIGKGYAALNGKANFGTDDLSQFVKEVGGVDKIKPGTPINNAVKSIIKLRESTYDPAIRNQLITTPELIKRILSQYPDGNVPAYVTINVQ